MKSMKLVFCSKYVCYTIDWHEIDEIIFLQYVYYTMGWFEINEIVFYSKDTDIDMNEKVDKQKNVSK